MRWKLAGRPVVVAAMCCCAAIVAGMDREAKTEGHAGQSVISAVGARPAAWVGSGKETASALHKVEPIYSRTPALFEGESDAGVRAGSDNNCSDATFISLTDQGGGHWIGSEVLSFVGPLSEVDGSEYPSCHGGCMVCNNVWRKFVATGSDATIDCCTSTALYGNSIIEVYSGTCSARVPLGCNDDSPGCAPGPTGDVGAKVYVSGLTPGQTYIIQVGVRKYGVSGCTEGDYTLTVDFYPDCTIECTSLSLEDELQPCGDPENTHINDGCNMDGMPVFAQITCNESICGTSMFDGSTRDTDFYRWVTPVAATIGYSAKAEFRASLLILGPQDPNLPISCDNYGLLADNDPNYFVPCADPGDTPLTLAVGPGEYWFFIAPSFDFGPVACGKQYQITLTASPCDPAPGACCVDSDCLGDWSQQDCVDILGGVWYGDGVACADVTCFECPSGAGVEDNFGTPDVAERDCDDSTYYPDVWNAGCGADLPDPTAAFTVIDCGETICGTSGTYLAPPYDPSDNLRDNDWFMVLDIPGTVGAWYTVKIDYLGEFPAEVFIASHTDVDNPCQTWTFEEIRYAEPGELISLSACIKKKGYAPAGQAWVIVRPYRRGAPREVPCGVRYYLTVDCSPCDTPGACCLGEGGCEMLTAAECEAGGGTFYNEGITCDDPIVCCPCVPGAIAENEPDCGDPPLNNGCWADDPGPPWLFSTIPAAGTHICGTLGDDDMDWYVYEHTGGLLRWCSTCERSVRMLVLIPESDDPNTWCADSMSRWEFYTPFDNCSERCIEIGADPGTYFLFIRRNFPDGETMPCPTYYDAVADSVFVGACCIPVAETESGECQILSETVCTAAGGEYLGGGTGCDPNPCCTFECDESGTPEYEPNCGLPKDIVNGGCNSDPHVFDTASLSGYPVVCGTVQVDGGLRDTDNYVYSHAGGDLVLLVAAEFHGHVLVYTEFDPANPCADAGGSSEAWVPRGHFVGSFDAPADCGAMIYSAGDFAAGDVLLIVEPELDYEIVCGAGHGRYELGALAGPKSACCLNDGAGRTYCVDTWMKLCLNDPWFVSWHPDTTCEDTPSICEPVGCPGDMNCDGQVDYDDIDLFVAALSCLDGDPNCWPTPGIPEDCQWLNADCEGDGWVSYTDIDPFVARIGAFCVQCDVGDTPEGEPALHDGYIDETDCGCECGDEAVFVPVAPNEWVCGRIGHYLDSGGELTADSDWYKLDLTDLSEPLELTWTVISEHPIEIQLIKAGPYASLPCYQYELLDEAAGASGDEAAVHAMAGGGTYLLRVTPRAAPAWSTAFDWRYRTLAHLPTEACCQPDGVCADMLAPDCVAAGWLPQGPESECEADCCDVECAPDATEEGEPDCFAGYVDMTDCGCACEGDPLFIPIGLNEAVCGTTGKYVDASGSPMGDEDWYQLDLTGLDPNYPLEFTWEVTAEYYVDVRVARWGPLPTFPCYSHMLLASESSAPCETLAITVSADTPGMYWLIVAPSAPYLPGVSSSCGWEYAAEIVTHVGACCLTDTPGGCVEPASVCVDHVSEAQCLAVAGLYQGDGTTCDEVECCGACCLPSCNCVETVGEAACLALDGEYRGDGTTCDTVDCCGACCLPSGVCLERRRLHCQTLHGVYQGEGTACPPTPPCPLDPCEYGDTAEGEPTCDTGYVDAYNGGCAASPPAFMGLVPDEWLCGALGVFDDGAGGTSRDEDWYEIEVAENAVLRWEVTAQTGLLEFGVAAPPCPTPMILAEDLADSAGIAVVEIYVTAGTYWLFVRPAAPETPETLPCGWHYRARASEVVGAACCFPDETCQDLSAADCLVAGGWPTCSETVLCANCPCPLDPCEPGDVAEGEPECYDGYVDVTNCGCDCAGALHFGSLLLGMPLCGTSGTFLVEDPVEPGIFIRQRDTDWYEILAIGGGVLTCAVESQFPVHVELIKAGSGMNPCEGTIVLKSDSAEPGELLQLQATVSSWVYYLRVMPQTDEIPPGCGWQYRATATLGTYWW